MLTKMGLSELEESMTSIHWQTNTWKRKQKQFHDPLIEQKSLYC